MTGIPCFAAIFNIAHVHEQKQPLTIMTQPSPPCHFPILRREELFFPVMFVLTVILLMEVCTSFFLMETTGSCILDIWHVIGLSVSFGSRLPIISMTLALLRDLPVRMLTARHFLDPAHPSERETVSSTVAAHTCECPNCSMNTPNPNQAVFS